MQAAAGTEIGKLPGLVHDGRTALAANLFMAAQFLVAVFPPGEPDDQDIEESNQDESERMRIHESVYLIDTENPEDENRQGIRPESVEPKRDHQQRLDQPVRQQIERSKMLPSIREAFRDVVKMRGDEFVAVKREVQLQEFQSDGIKSPGLYGPEDHTSDGFQKAVDALESDARAEALVKQQTPPVMSLRTRKRGRMNC